MEHVPPNETMADIIDERIVAFGLRANSKDRTGIHGLAKQITDRIGVRFSDTNLTNWRNRGRRPTDDLARRFAVGTAGPSYQGGPERPALTSEHMLQRVLRARSGLDATEAGPELSQRWQYLPPDVRRDLNALIDRLGEALERTYWDGRNAAATHDDGGADDGPSRGFAQN